MNARWTLGVLGLVSLACSSDGRAGASPLAEGGSGAPGAAGADAGPRGSGGAGATADAACPAPRVPFGDAGALAAPVQVDHIDGRIVDGAGAPWKEGQLVSACGPQQCNPGFTDAEGRFRIDVGFAITTGVYSVQVHTRPDATAFYHALPADAPGPIVDVGDLRVLAMPASGPALVVDRAGAAAQSVTSGDVTLEVPTGVYVRLDVESNLAQSHGKEFRALRIPDPQIGEYAPASLGVRALYALEPFEVSFEQAGCSNLPIDVRLSFANSAGLADGAVELLALGTYIYPDWIPPGQFARVASGRVSSDGSRIELDPGEGLPYLTWVALRPAPP